MQALLEPVLPTFVSADAPLDNRIAIARQAIVDETGTVFGYELFNRSPLGSGHSVHTDAALIFHALAHADGEFLAGSKTIFVNCTHESLSSPHLDLVTVGRVVLEVPVLPDPTPELVQAQALQLHKLRERGFHLAFNQAVLRKMYTPWLPLASYIKLDMTTFHLDVAQQLVRAVRGYTKAQIVAEKVETEEQYQHMRALDVQLFQGYWFAHPSVVQSQTLHTSQSTIIELINLVRQPDSIDAMEVLLRKEPALTLELLHFINKSKTEAQSELTSFREAVTALGPDKLFRWAALLLVMSRGLEVSPAVSSTAAVRGRLMELLAIEMKLTEQADMAFVVGAFSLLDALLGMPLDRALSTISVPPAVSDALLHNTGVLATLLLLARACETGDEERFASAANALDLSSHQVNWSHLQALAWVDQMDD